MDTIVWGGVPWFSFNLGISPSYMNAVSEMGATPGRPYLIVAQQVVVRMLFGGRFSVIRSYRMAI